MAVSVGKPGRVRFTVVPNCRASFEAVPAPLGVDFVGVDANYTPGRDEGGGEGEGRGAVVDVGQAPALEARGRVAAVDDLDVLVRLLARDAAVEEYAC